MDKIERYKEINEAIFKIATKKRKLPKDFDKLEELHSEQEELCKSPEVMEYIYATVKN